MKKVHKMEVSNVNFISINSDIDEIVNNDKDLGIDPWQDPLSGVQNEAQDATIQAFYRMERVVFAEPINSIKTDEKVRESSNNLKESDSKAPINEMIFIDNIIVEKRKGKKNKKYHIDVDSTNPVCPQPNCKRKFSTTTLLKAHIRKIHCADPSAYVCDRCGAGFKSQLMLKRHSAVHEMRRAQCKVCLVTLSECTNMAQHLRSHSNTRRHECHVCHKLFLRKSTLDIHVKFVHRHGELSCDKCDARFGSRLELSRHSSTHRQKAPKI